jgi:hypothetical protein
LLNLLNLKSNAASLAEAKSSARIAEESAKMTEQGVKEAQVATTQGRAVMLFTIVTVIFVSPTATLTSLTHT